MRRRQAMTILLVVGVLLVASVAGVALAKTITCKSNPCNGTKKADVITGRIGTGNFIQAKGGKDRVTANGATGSGNANLVYGGNGNDTIDGGPGDDDLFGQGGDDTISDTDGPSNGDPADKDFVEGGSGGNYVDVFDGDALDIVCHGGFVTFDSNDSVNDPANCP